MCLEGMGTPAKVGLWEDHMGPSYEQLFIQCWQWGALGSLQPGSHVTKQTMLEVQEARPAGAGREQACRGHSTCPLPLPGGPTRVWANGGEEP